MRDHGDVRCAKPSWWRTGPVTNPNPRRTPSHLSKSLPPSKRQKLAHGADSHGNGILDSAIVPMPLTSQRSSSDESASRWFEKANENGLTSQDGSVEKTEEEPFFLGAQQSSHPDNFDSAYGDDPFGAEHQGDGVKEELREVIDDLTVENKRLKRLLKSQRSTPQPRPAANDRLFDIRVHGLSAEKKCELELLLRNFTAHAKNPASRSRSSATCGSVNTKRNLGWTMAARAAPLQQRKEHHNTDSGYGTNSHDKSFSGGHSTAVSSGGQSAVPVSSSSRNKNIKSYLHDIPDTLLPRQAPFMSERAKQVLVVRRLEQLFTGKQAAPGDHSQPIQQQEVSNSAARADARPNPTAKTEGKREARILPYDATLDVDSVERQEASRNDTSPISNTNFVPTQPGSPNQRPTRPLDLDIQRAQVASDNMEYIRHLGLSTPRTHQANASKDQSWIYLNLLTGMAQLHTLNVTPAFVQKAINKMSTKFELSEDGRQVRWKGDSEGSSLPACEDRAIETVNENLPEVLEERSGSSSRRSKTNSSSNNVVSEEPSFEDSTLYTSGTSQPNEETSADLNQQTSCINVKSKPVSGMTYQPMIYKGKRYSAAASYLESISSSSPSADSGDLVRKLSNSTLDKERGSDEGMITYYSNPFFCSDATADKSPFSWKPLRRLMSGEGLGTKQNAFTESPLRAADACYFTPQFAPKPSLGEVDETNVCFQLPPISASGEQETYPIKMEASGIGGVCPEDNFAVDVKVMRHSQSLQADEHPDVVPITGSRKRKRYTYRTAEREIFELQPSKLPPPSYVFFTSSSSSANPDMENSDSDASSSANEEVPAPALSLSRWSTGSFGGDFSVGEDVSESLDMLAMARAADPDRVASQEREYIINHPPRNEGSLAATVGASQSSSSDDELGEDEENLQDGISDVSVDGEMSENDGLS